MGQLPVMVVAPFLYLENALECEIPNLQAI